MTPRFISSLVAICLLILSGCTDPFIGVPGGKLKGQLTAPPGAWPKVPDVVQVEFRSDDPYSINIWAVTLEGNLYIATREAKWVPFVAKDPAVVVRIDDRLYELEAAKVTDTQTIAALADAYTAKYDYDVEGDETFTTADVFQLKNP